jgi:hypothetical protein
MSLTDFFTPDHLRPRPVDADGYELPEWENPYFAIPPDDDVAAALHEIRMIAQYIGNDDCVPCSDLLEWAADVLEGAIVPTEADEKWLAAQNADADGWQEYAIWCHRLEELHQASEYLDRLEAINGPHGITDQDIVAAGLPLG